jgi:hypothetical protein
MINDSQKEDGTKQPNRTVEIKEGLWLVAMSCIGIIFIALLHQSSKVIGEYSKPAFRNFAAISAASLRGLSSAFFV